MASDKETRALKLQRNKKFKENNKTKKESTKKKWVQTQNGMKLINA